MTTFLNQLKKCQHSKKREKRVLKDCDLWNCFFCTVPQEQTKAHQVEQKTDF